MRRLVIDSATEACSVALFEGNTLIAADFAMLGRGHAERLVPMIAALPEKGRADLIAVDVGPGSFTGIRVGLAAARALGLAWNAKVEGYESLSLVAAMARAQLPGAAVDVCMTGGHGEWFFQQFDPAGVSKGPVESLRPEEVLARSSADVAAGSQAAALANERNHVTALDLRPDARAFAVLATPRFSASPRPIYGRAPDARLPAPKA